ncbi:MAG: cyclic nucleotide-binding domain-containing protein [Proteobacteria bacterium]|nr:cyclic nucleotide-binding domain-containing protein [Pseudomonadota bacterium]
MRDAKRMSNMRELSLKDDIKETVSSLLLKLPMFDEIDGEELSIISGYMNYFELTKGRYLFKEGDEGNFICFVVKGGIDIIKKTGSGEPRTIATIHKGASLGEMSVIDKTSRSASARAKTDATLLILSEKSFNILLDKHPKIGIKLLKGMTRILSLNMRRTSSLLADYMPTI